MECIAKTIRKSSASVDADISSENNEFFVKKQVFCMAEYTTVSGRKIKNLRIGWESYGVLNEAKNNVIIVPHFFSGNSHAAGKYQPEDSCAGYWNSVIGIGKPIDISKYFVISFDSLVNLNTKDGVTVSSGPSCIEPDSQRPYALSFPVVTVRDFVRVQKALLDSLGIKKIYAAIGLSMGAMQTYEWAAAYPDMVDRIIPVCGTPTQSPFSSIALEPWSGPVQIDPDWNGGNYYGKTEPIAGLAQALFNIAVSGVHRDSTALQFGTAWGLEGHDPWYALENDFLIEKKFKDEALYRAKNFTDANHLLYLCKAIKLFIAGTPGSSVDPEFRKILTKTLVIGVRTDRLLPPELLQAHVARFKTNGTDAQYYEIDSDNGHVAGITEISKAGNAMKNFLDS